jgi:hypothetical protein
MSIRPLVLGGFAASGLAILALVGCNKSEPAPAPVSPGDAKSDEHVHKPGAHGGIIVPLGRDSYHVEAVFEAKGTIRLYTLGKDEARVQEVAAQELIAFVSPTGSNAAEQVKFTPTPQTGDAPGKTSLFVGTLPPALRGKEVRAVINNIHIGEERFRFEFARGNAGHGDAMPEKLGSEKEQKVFFTPGGKYTTADIAANGSTVPSVKYGDVDIEHDDAPKPGEKICPISKTKANPKLTWIIGGKNYEFCCTPCVQEFVQKAKEKPGEIHEPETYRAK